jgi:hypothetical protein
MYNTFTCYEGLKVLSKGHRIIRENYLDFMSPLLVDQSNEVLDLCHTTEVILRNNDRAETNGTAKKGSYPQAMVYSALWPRLNFFLAVTAQNGTSVGPTRRPSSDRGSRGVLNGAIRTDRGVPRRVVEEGTTLVPES